MPQLRFQTISEQGSHYEIGYQRGCLIATSPEYTQFMTSPQPSSEALSDANYQSYMKLLVHHCPGLDHELQGMADALKVPITQMMHWTYGFSSHHRACSMVAALPEKTTDQHFYLARSYEYATFDELIFSITRVTGKHAHMGFSLFHLGRFDGINDAGLCVAISSAEVVHSSKGQASGLFFAFATRALLDNCSTVEEAVQKLQSMPLNDTFTYMLADAQGNCAVVETVADKGLGYKAVRRPVNGYLSSFNHFQSQQLQTMFPKRKNFSHWREEAVDTLFRKDQVSRDDLLHLLKTKIPNGLCYHDYNGYFGTLRSMLFDVSASKLYVCFGSPQLHPYFEADWHTPVGVSSTMVDYIEETAPQEFWKTVKGF